MIRAIAVLFVAVLAGAWFVDAAAAYVPDEFQPNYDKGYSVGYPKGYKSGLVTGKERGRTEGRENGTNDGKNDGWEAAFQPAYDIAYDAKFPQGHFAGWKDGLYEGFDDGFDYAPVIAKQVYEYYGIDTSSSISMSSGTFVSNWFGDSAGGVISINGTYNFGGSSSITISSGEPIRVDYSKVYYDKGYSVGQATGFSNGSQDGYDLMYPKAYAAAYAPAFKLGVWDGTREGTKQGRTDGYDEGFTTGYDAIYNEAFYAGIDYRLFGEFSISKYSLDYSRRSNAFTRQALVAAQAPEPGSAVLAILGAVAMMGNSRRKRRR